MTWRDLAIDFAAPPFAGHLFPLLELAGYLRAQGMSRLRVLTTSDGAATARRCGLSAVDLLPGCEAQVWAIADPGRRVGSDPRRLLGQFRANLALMGGLRDQLRGLWQAGRPDLVIADFTVPVAGLLARGLGVPWWTSMPTPCALETRTGTPAYLGGWSPRADRWGRLRDVGGRALVRLFKRAVAALFRRELRALGLPGAYRPDGLEAAYSPECILGLGMRELEFERDWPPALHFIGPLTAAPPLPAPEPVFAAGKRHVLVSLGTHLEWAKGRAAALVTAAARDTPDLVWHFSWGRPGSAERRVLGNLHFYGHVPYDRHLARYAAAVIHGGTGVTYACIEAGVPMLVWPQDYDQFDHAARVVGRGLGLRLRPGRAGLLAGVRHLLADEGIRECGVRFRALAAGYDARLWVRQALEGQEVRPGGGGLVVGRADCHVSRA